MSCLRMVARRGVVEEATPQNWEKTQSKSAPPSPFFSSSQIFILSLRLLLPYCLGFGIYSHPVLIQLSSILIQTFSPFHCMFTLQIVVLVVSKLKACLDLHCNKCVCQPSNYKIIIFVFLFYFLGRSFEFFWIFLFKMICDLIHLSFNFFFSFFSFYVLCLFEISIACFKTICAIELKEVMLEWRERRRNMDTWKYVLWVSFLVWSMFVKILTILWRWVKG